MTCPELPFTARDRIFAPEITSEQQQHIQELRSLINIDVQNLQSCVYHHFESHERTQDLADQARQLVDTVVDDNCLHRYLRARSFHLNKAHCMLAETIAWRLFFRPEISRAADFEEEARMGKTYLPVVPYDKFGRPIIVLDNTKKSVLDHHGQIRFLVYQLERAVARCRNNVEKFLIFIHLEDFAFSTAPSLKLTMETVTVLGHHFPERLGTCVMYRPPMIFSTLWGAVKPIVDPVTRAKVLFISGDCGVGSKNDKLLSEIIGVSWREITGAEQAVLVPGASPGYDHASIWKVTQEEESQRLATVTP